MNDVTYVEAARKLAERMMREGGAAPESRIALGFMLATSRPPEEREAVILLSSLHYYRDSFASSADAAAKFLSQGESPRDLNLDVRELAAYAAVASTILNLDAALTKD
jgi:hypothetical protein